jgi:photosystem II stability/assembly factor-like uncharacterized protein
MYNERCAFHSTTFMKEGITMKSTFLQKHSMISVIIVFIVAAVMQMSLVEIVHAQGTWTQQVSPATLSLISVKAVNQNVAWASGNGGTVLRCIDGSSWTKVDGGAFGTNSLFSICAINANTALVTFYKAIDLNSPRQLSDTTWIYRTTNGGSSWQIVFQQIGGMIEGMQMIDSLNGIAFGDPTPGDSTLTVLRTRDGGAHWSRIAIEPVADKHQSDLAELGYVQSLAATDTNHIWFTTALFPTFSSTWIRRTTDGGKTWNRHTYPHPYANALSFSDSLRGLSSWWGGGQAGCDQTTDGGQTWTTVYVRPYTSGSGNYGSNAALPGGRFWMTDSSNVYEFNASDPLQLGLPLAQKTILSCPTIYWIDTKKDNDLIFGWLVTQTGKIYKCQQNAKSLLARTYTVGKTGYFPSLDSAFARLSRDGILGPVTLSLIDTLYDATTNVSGSFNLVGPIAGAGPASRITIRPADNVAVTIKGNGDAALWFNNVSYLTLDGVNLQGNTRLKVHALYNASFKYNDGIDFWGNSDHNIVQNLTASSDDITRTSCVVAFYGYENLSGSSDSCLISGLSITSGYIGIYLYGPAGMRLNGNVIRNNHIGSPSDSLIAIGIYNDLSSEGTIIENNHIENLRLSGVSAPSTVLIGIALSGSKNSIIRNNIVHNIRKNDVNYVSGIHASTLSTTSERGLNNWIYNNKVWDITNSSVQCNKLSGIDALYQDSLKVDYNSVYLSESGDTPPTDGSNAVWFQSTCVYPTVRNNILVNTRDDAPYVSVAIRMDAPTCLSDHNDLFVGSSGSANIGKMGTTLYKSFADWRSAVKDSHSISMSPIFITHPMHIDTTNSTSNALEGKGTPITGILTDFEGQKRNSTTPDIGADEFERVGSGFAKDGSRVPDIFALLQNYPNPFNPSTTIEFQLPAEGYAKLTVYNLIGQEVVTLVNEKLSAGTYRCNWDARNLPSGVYFYRLVANAISSGQAGSFVETKKLMLLK